MFHSTHGPALGWMLVGVLIVFAPWLSERVRLPGVIGLLVGGALIGAHGLDLISNPAVLQSVGSFGLLYLMFLAGLELDLGAFAALRRVALGFGLLTFALPLLAGFAVAWWAGYSLAAAVLIGSFWASHTLVTYPEFRRRGKSGNRAVAATVGATIITDTLALIVLAVIAGLQTGSRPGAVLALQILAGLGILVVYSLWVLPRIARLVFRSVGQEAVARFVFTAAAFASAALLAEVVGIEGIVGAFFAGLGINRLVSAASALMERVEFVGSAIFVPAFLVWVGTLVDPVLLASTATLRLAGLFLVALVVGKAAAALIAGALFRMRTVEIAAMFSLSLPQAAATLAATVVGSDLGLYGAGVVNAVIVVIVVSILISSILVSRCAPRLTTAAVDTPDIGSAVLLPLSADRESGAVAALSARLAANSHGLVVPLRIVLDRADPTHVPKARAALADAAASLAKLGVETRPALRVDQTAAAALQSESIEQQASLVILDTEDAILEPADATEFIRAAAVPTAILAGSTQDGYRRVLVVLDKVDLERYSAAASVAVRIGARCAGRDTPVVVITPTDGRDWALQTANAGKITVTATREQRFMAARKHLQPGDLLIVTGRRAKATDRAAHRLTETASVLTVHAPTTGAGTTATAVPARIAVGRLS